MPKTYRLERAQFVPRPRSEVFPFFADAGNLESITPDFVGFRILTPRPIAMRAGTIIDYQIKLFGVPLNWRTEIESFDPPERFVDVQRRGPYRLWRHTHRFLEQPGGTLLVDEVDYQLPAGPLGPLAHALFVRRSLDRIFAHRQAMIARLFGEPASAAAKPVVTG
ncbi:MAG: SRPBCC family protein [Pirellulales bacterium]